MRFFVDESLSPRVADVLTERGHEAVHVRDRGLERAADPMVLEYARREERVLVTADTDFGDLLAREGGTAPSIVLFRRSGQRRAAERASLLLANLETVEEELTKGAIVVFEGERVRVRRLPLPPAERH